MKAIYSDDKDKGAGHGFLRIGDAQVGNMEGLRFSIKRGTDHNCLGPGGWQPAESPFTAQRITLSDDGFDIAVGPEVVDHLDTRENYRLSLMSVDGVSVVGAAVHNLAQLVVAAFLVETRATLSLLPILLLSALAAGVVTGAIAKTVFPLLKPRSSAAQASSPTT